uniref:DNA helicase n=1 Tax=Salix viminalis TaxID=40686 RepID=A0A6N2NA08_SALVM
MGEGDMPLDDKAKRTRDLLSSFYSPDPSVSNTSNSFRFSSLDAINSTSFDADQYMNLLVQTSNLEGLLQRHVEMAAEIKNLDTDLQMLVYENYNKFISATDTIKRMKSNIVGMETSMEQLLGKARAKFLIFALFKYVPRIARILWQYTSHTNFFLSGIEQFIYDLPARLGKCIKSEAYADAVKFYIGAMPIFKAYGDSSFQDCKQASEEVMATIIKKLQGKLFLDSESIQARAEAAILLKKLNFPVCIALNVLLQIMDNLKAKLFEKLEQSLEALQLKHEDITNVLVESNNPSEQGNNTESVTGSAHDALVCEFAEAVQAFQVIFPDSEKQLIKLSQDLIAKHFEITAGYIKEWIPIANFLGVLRIIWKDVLLMDKVLHEALLPDYSLKASQVAVKQYIKSTFSHLLNDISDSLTNVHIKPKEEAEEHLLVVFLEAGKTAVLQGSLNVLLDFRQLLEENLGGIQLSNLIVEWVQEGFQDFFRALHDRFLLLSGKNKSASQDEISTENMQEIAAYFSGGGGRASENGPALVPGEICQTFHSDGEMFLQHYTNTITQKISVLLRKRFTAPNWVKLEAIGTEAKQILPHGALRKHRRTESNGSSASSRSNPLREDRMIRSNTHRARSQLLETHLAKLFKQKVEIFTKTEYTQESVITTVVKLCLKSFLEFVRLQTFNRSGFQQIQLDIQFLRASLKEIVEDEAAIDFLLDEVIVGASERCLDPIPLEPPILDKLIQANLEGVPPLLCHDLITAVLLSWSTLMRNAVLGIQESRAASGGNSGAKEILSNLAKDFLSNFADANGESKYMNILYKDLDEEFLRRVTENTRRYIGIFADAIDEVLPKPTEAFLDDDHDILMTQRSEDATENVEGSDANQKMPSEIKRYFEVYIRAPSKGRPSTLREVKASNIGQLVKISGIVTRCSDVKPLMQVAVYTCEECGFEIYQEVTARVFMPLFECPTKRCKTNNTKGNLILQLRASKFLKFQEAKIQELAEHVPKGHIPRSMTVHFRGELTRKVAPGDVVELSGIFLPIPYTGFRAMRAGLVADTYLEAMSVTHFKKKYEEYELRGDEEEQIARLAEDGDIYNKLAQSLAPEIYGHEDIKKALLLLLVGAPHRKLKDGMKIRGDLHLCLMGDPGVAKSQLLKHIINVAPRGVYTTGKGSSGVGLTAAVQKDPVTNEMVLEGGALVLADMGICAIDEFDKMDESDRTAIHEVMEQQTVSIAKAGITTSLNARTAVLAAANPAWGRYDLRRTPAENINLPPALLSRFDLLWLILDRADMDSDLEMARHVVYVHQNKESPALGFTPLEPSVLRYTSQ